MGSFDAEQWQRSTGRRASTPIPLLLGYACRKRAAYRCPSLALLRAMELNGVQVDNDQAALNGAVRCAHDLTARAKRCYQHRTSDPSSLEKARPGRDDCASAWSVS